MPTYIQNDNGLYYEVDPNTGEMLYTDVAPQNYDPNNPDPTVFTKQVQTGTENDPNSKLTYYKAYNGGYAYGGMKTTNWKNLKTMGYYRTSQSLKDMRNAYKQILGGKEITEFERMLAQDGQDPVNLTKRDLKRDDIRRTLLYDGKYNTEEEARIVRDAYMPQMKKLKQLGRLEDLNVSYRHHRLNSRQRSAQGTTHKITRPCINCWMQKQIAQQEGGQGTQWSNKSTSSPRLRSGYTPDWQWKKAEYQTIRPGISKHVRYTNQIPVYQTQYAAGVPGSQEEYTEVIESAVPATQTTVILPVSTKSNTTPIRRKLSVNSAKVRTSKPVTTSLVLKPASSTRTEQTWIITRDPNGQEISRTLKQSNGGKLNYFDYFK